MTKIRVVAVVGVLALISAGCGSRLSNDELKAQSGGTGTSGGGSAGTGTSGGGTSGGSDGSGAGGGGDSIGSLKWPCGAKGSGGSTAPPPPAPAGGSVPGVTPTSIRIGVISDRKNDITPVPTIGIQEAVQGFVDACNSRGGINGRKLELKTYDAGIFKNDDVTKEACNDNLFALVGDGSVQDQQGVSTREGCGLPEVAAYSATPERATSKDFFQPVPGTQPTQFNIGPCLYLKKKFPNAVKKAAVTYTDVPASKQRGLADKEACTKAGFTFVVDKGIAFGEKNFGPLVSEMKSKGVKYFTIVSVVPDTAALLREMKNQDFKPDVIDLGQQYYDKTMAAEPAADGSYVLTNTTPFAETDKTAALKVYRDALKKVSGEETSLGVQAFSASMLFAQAASSLGDNLTRESLVKALQGVHQWDGGGLQMTTDPGANKHNACFLYLQIKGGSFVRSYPDKGFACDPKNVITLSKEYKTTG